MEYFADFTMHDKVTDEEKDVKDFHIHASTKQDAIKQIKEWFWVIGKIRIIANQ